MSFYRKVLQVTNETYKSGQDTLPLKIVVWCCKLEQTSRTIKTNHIGVSVYVNGKLSNYGFEAWHPMKPVSLKLNKPMESKFFLEHDIQRMINQAFSSAYSCYCQALGPQQGKVRWFNSSSGKGAIQCLKTERILPVYACNIIGAKTGFPETACMTLDEGQIVTFEHHEQCGAVNVTGGKFDAESWNKLDHDNLAFKMDEDGNFISGMFK